ncbi:MAG: methionyl-tRNA formyltransferase [candidate division Zixibacteria bacterium]|nr:methionyl-tRNA formyltransferase [candidate division Zixibacteria bacterium]
MNYVLATSRVWHEKMAKDLQEQSDSRFDLISRKEDLNIQTLNKLNPRYIFLPHWSYIIPAEVYANFECVIFHMTDVPFGRGGSPLQNLIVRGIYDTKISALRCVRKLDAGPVYLKRPLSLYGTAEEIFLRAGKIIEEMIIDIIDSQPEPVEQSGEEVVFTRRKPKQSNIDSISGMEKLYDHIRMLDADGYPHSFLKAGKFRFEFRRASLRKGRIVADVEITEVDNE